MYIIHILLIQGLDKCKYYHWMIYELPEKADKISLPRIHWSKTPPSPLESTYIFLEDRYVLSGTSKQAIVCNR